MKEILTNEDYVRRTLELLENDTRWPYIYKKYAEDIEANEEDYKSKSKMFRINKPLILYSTIGKVKAAASTKIFDIRFGGQSVGEIHVRKDGSRLLKVTAKQADYAKKYFGFAGSKALSDVDWNDKDAHDFRMAYYNPKVQECGTHSDEHRIESLVLEEFSKTSSEMKLLCNIQPIRLGGRFFQLTTPLAASNHEPKMTKESCKGGGIDILARAKHKNEENRIVIIELKDENKKGESQKKVMFQALTYAAFIASLLRSESGSKWYNIFGFKNESVPKSLNLDVVTLMPEGESEEGELAPITIDSLNVTLHLYTMYYRKNGNHNLTEFMGTFPEALKKKK